jgi:hypothetical protein
VQVAGLKTISTKSDAEAGILGYIVTFLVPLEMIAPVDWQVIVNGRLILMVLQKFVF